MRRMGALSIVASLGLLSGGTLGRPTPPRVIHPYPIYRTDSIPALDLRTSGEQILESQAHLELSFAAFSKAIEIGFVNVVIRPHEHLASLLRYYKTSERLPALPINAKHGLQWSTSNPEKPYRLRGPDGSEQNEGNDTGPFSVRDHRKRDSDRPGAATVRAPDYRRGVRFKRSSTHASSGEHLKARGSVMA